MLTASRPPTRCVAALRVQVVILFRYLYDKDVFETYYKTHLQKRLLGNRSLSNDIERIMITKLKVRVGVP